MSEEDFSAIVELMRAIAREAVRDNRPMHQRSPKNNLEENAIENARIFLVRQ